MFLEVSLSFFFGVHANKRRFVVTDVEMRWHEERTFQNREISERRCSVLLRGALMGMNSNRKTGAGLCDFDPTNAEERQQISRILARCRDEQSGG